MQYLVVGFLGFLMAFLFVCLGFCFCFFEQLTCESNDAFSVIMLLWMTESLQIFPPLKDTTLHRHKRSGQIS